ncbi:hypothetical protein FRB90_004025 [Tulasnella sp. 427]|nr:hypothetical protein FRB90_004025 [Tulasnella sp. 427]
MAYSIAEFKAQCKGTVAEPGDEGYNYMKWAPNGGLPSKIVVMPSDTNDIAKAIKFARANGLDIGILGGGHNNSTASASNGLLLNMRKLNTIQIDEKSKVGYIQSGALVGEIEDETAKYGLGACVPIYSQISIGGYVTAGGFGFSMGAHGLAADSLLSATVVLATGEIVDASATENPDLFWAIKGGGSNFGVVAEVRVKLHDHRADAFAFSAKVYESLFVTMICGPDQKPYVIVNGVSNTTEEEGEAAFKGFVDLGPVQITAGQVPWTQTCHYLDAVSDAPANKIIGGAHIDVFDVAQVQKVYEAWERLLQDAPFSAIMCEFYHCGRLADVPLVSAAFAQRYQLKTVLCACSGYSDEYLPHARDTLMNIKKVISASSSPFAQQSIGYVNYGDAYCTLNETEEYTKQIFGPNYPRLQAIKKKYDPEGVFNRWFAIKPGP